MKKLIIAILIALPLGLHAQTGGIDKLIKKYETQKGVMAINLEGNILEGIIYFVQQFDGGNDYSSDYEEQYVYEDDDSSDAESEEEAAIDTYIVEGDDVVEEYTIAEAVVGEYTVAEAVAEDENEDAESDEYEYIYGEEGDYDYDDSDYDFDYSDYYNPYSSLSNYLGMFKAYLDGLTYMKAIVYENPSKKFSREVQKQIVSKKPYKCVVSVQENDGDIRLYIIDNEAEGTCELLAIVKEGDTYIVGNILGNRDFKGLINTLKELM